MFSLSVFMNTNQESTRTVPSDVMLFHVVHGATYAENVERKVEARFRVVQVNPESTERPLP